MKVACAFDHAGFPLKALVLDVVAEQGHEPVDLGTNSTDPVDYPDIARAGADAVREGRAERAIVVCGSGAGVAVAACKVPGIRATCAHDTYTARQCVEHDDVNVLCLGARVIGPALAGDVMRAFLGARFTNEERHVRRLGKIEAIEQEFSQCRDTRWRTPAISRRRTCRSPSTGWSATCTPSRWWARRARSTGTAARRSTPRACSAASSTPRTAATTPCGRRRTAGPRASSTSPTPTS